LYNVVDGTISVPPFTGDTSNCTPLHVTVLIALITGVGFTYTTKVKESYTVQLGTNGITVYVADRVTFVPFDNLPEINVNPLPAAPPVKRTLLYLGVSHE
jgi:hypothetical protein